MPVPAFLGAKGFFAAGLGFVEEGLPPNENADGFFAVLPPNENADFFAAGFATTFFATTFFATGLGLGLLTMDLTAAFLGAGAGFLPNKDTAATGCFGWV